MFMTYSTGIYVMHSPGEQLVSFGCGTRDEVKALLVITPQVADIYICLSEELK
jgi:hypothetical protein